MNFMHFRVCLKYSNSWTEIMLKRTFLSILKFSCNIISESSEVALVSACILFRIKALANVLTSETVAFKKKVLPI